MVDLAYLESLLVVLRKHDVTTYKDGDIDLLVQLQPKMPEFAAPEVDPGAQVPGGWKRTADLDGD